jgi:hypothetical protein
MWILVTPRPFSVVLLWSLTPSFQVSQGFLKRQEHKSLSQFLLDLLLRVEPDFPEPVLPAVLEPASLLTRAELLPQQGLSWQVGGILLCWNQPAFLSVLTSFLGKGVAGR